MFKWKTRQPFVLGPLLSFLVLILSLAGPATATPTVEFATIFGGTYGDTALGVAVDDNGYSYACGWVRGFSAPGSGDFPVTPGAYQTVYGGGGNVSSDAYVVRLDPGGAMTHATYFGGNGNETCDDLEIDDAGNVYIVGRTSSTNLPTPNGFQSSKSGSNDVFIAKLNNDLSTLVYASYLGGGGDDVGPTLALHPTTAEAYVALRTTGAFPVGPGFDTSFNGGTWDWVVSKISASGSSKLYSTYLGGSEREQPVPHIAVDADGSAYLASSSRSINYPTTPGVIQPTDLNGAGNWRESPVVTKLAPDGLSLEWSTYFGTSDGSREVIEDIRVDAQENVYLTGAFNGSDFPGTTGLDPVANEIFVSKLAADGASVFYTANYGTGAGYSITLGEGGDVAICGATFGTLTTLVDPIQTVNLGKRDMALVHLDSQGTTTFASLLGSAADEAFCEIDMDPNGNAYVAASPADISTWPSAVPTFTAFTPTGTLALTDGGLLRIDGMGPAGSDPTLVGAASFDEGSGTLADFGDGTSGDLVGGAGWGNGQQGGALELDGTGYVEVLDTGDSDFDLSDALTLALWIRPDALGGTQVLISKDDAYEFEFGRNGTDVYGLRVNNGEQGFGVSAITEGVWQHLAVTWDGSIVRYYMNGAADGSDPFPGPIDTNNTNIGIGARPTPAVEGGPTYHFVGGIDDVRIYNRALSDGEVADLFSSTVSDIDPPVRSNALPGTPLASGSSGSSVTFGLSTGEHATCRYALESEGIRYADMGSTFASTGATAHDSSTTTVAGVTRYFARCRDALGNTNSSDFLVPIVVGDVDLLSGLETYWTLDDGTGCTATDGQMNADGTLEPDCSGGNAPTWDAGVLGSGLLFDGDDDAVRATLPSGLATPAGVTIGGWIRHLPTVQYRAIVDVRDAGADGYNLYLSDRSKLFMRVGGATLASPAAVADNTWHHVVGVYDGASITLYVDGQSVGSGTASGAIDVTADIFLGHHYRGQAENGFTLGGRLDEVTIHGRGLNAEEIYQLFLDTMP